MKHYMPRILDTVLSDALSAFGAVLVTGPKWCGKTTTCLQQASSVLYMQDPDQKDAQLQLAEVQPSLLLQGEHPRLIDEWQMAPQLWDAVRHAVDVTGEEGLFILTGSTTVDEHRINHSGAGRIARIHMYTMSLHESGDSSGEITLEGLFAGPASIGSRCPLSVEAYAKLIVRGGWPGVIGKSERASRMLLAGYCDTLVESEIRMVDGVTRDPARTETILRAYSRHVGSQAPNTTLLEDVRCHFDSMHINTLDSYLTALRDLHVIDELTAWSPKLRSKTTIRLSNTRHFTDPAIAAYFLQASPENLLQDINTFGFLFESLAIRDLRVYTQRLGGKVMHYRDKSGLEADAVIHLPDGRWAAVEVKLGAGWVEQAAENLKKMAERVDQTHMPPPAFLMVITGTEYAYRRKDGVYVVPLGCLG